jgi:hypothetical protein
MHDHDNELQLRRKNFIYLYRDPVDTIYSQIKYQKEGINNREIIKKWLDKYIRHLNKYLLQDNFSENKVIIKYERLKTDMNGEFLKITNFFKTRFDERKLDSVASQVNKEKVKAKTSHDTQVVNLSSEYEMIRNNFRHVFSEFIYREIKQLYPDLCVYI